MYTWWRGARRPEVFSSVNVWELFECISLITSQAEMETASWSISHMLISYQGKVPVSVLASFQLQCLSFDNWLQGSLRLSSDLWLFLSSLSGVLGTYTVVDESCPIGPAGLGFMEKSHQSLQWSSSGSSLVLSQHLGLTGVLGGVGV